MAEPVKRHATYADLEAVPPHLVAEIIDGSLVTHPRPAPRHSAAAFSLADELASPFQKGRGGPGGWIFLSEPELHLGRDVVVPDLAGWRRERLSIAPDTSHVDIVPDWVCEILSPSTEMYDRGAKRRIYAEAGVMHLLHIEPRAQLLEVFALVAGQWLLAATFTGREQVSAPPFEAISFPLDALWPFDLPLETETTS